MRRFFVWAPAAALIGLAGSSWAEGMKVTPGMWEIKSTMESPMMPEPRKDTNKQCITDGEMTPEMVAKDAQGCKISNATSSEGSMSFKMSCGGPQGQMQGDAKFSSTGESMTGTMKMTMTVQGQTMNFDQKFEGKHVGDCEEGN